MTTATPALPTTSTCPSTAPVHDAGRPPSARATRTEPAALTVTVARGARGTVLRLDGELEATTAPLLDCLVADVVDRHRGDLSVDLTRTAFCDVKGLNSLLAARRRVHARGRHLTLVGPDPLLRHLLRISGAGDVVASAA
ncbi:STAS domain-containing protein [Kineococcus rubinsiae]|uniref:STAS domain-containing protein n=1 Tax=Kineococcus rubinsiae TaxID=2609562 RepID=UPI001430ACE5|nr:STAS domain-containing protein [Kineococcus rubinsiae]